MKQKKTNANRQNKLKPEPFFLRLNKMNEKN